MINPGNNNASFRVVATVFRNTGVGGVVVRVRDCCVGARIALKNCGIICIRARCEFGLEAEIINNRQAEGRSEGTHLDDVTNPIEI